METVGTLLKKTREKKLMSLIELSRVTRIPSSTLQRMETDRWTELPGEVFVRGFIRSYALAVGLDANEMVARYSSGRRIALETPLPVASPIQAAGEVQKRRFGFAIAFVLLLILFTLALSIVLKPRGQDIPPELSARPVSHATYA